MEYDDNGQDELKRIISLGKQRISKFGGVVPLVVISLFIGGSGGLLHFANV